VNNCGACGKRCSSTSGTPLCEAGVCSVRCGSGLTACGESCVNTSSDTKNCGKCGTRCALLCVGGLCL
jgi:hypothetical protein